MITLALSKGRIFEDSLPLLAAAGIEVLDDPEKSRKLILSTSRPDLRVVLVRATDVPTYVQYGGADLGVAGNIVWAWVLTIPASAFVAAIAYWVSFQIFD